MKNSIPPLNSQIKAWPFYHQQPPGMEGLWVQYPGTGQRSEHGF